LPADRPTHFGEVIATLYKKMGINPNTASVPDLTGRPHYVTEHQPIAELL